MSAQEKVTPKKLGIVAGSGNLPPTLIESCLEQDIEPVIVGINNQTDERLMQNHTHMWSGLGSAGKIIDFFKQNEVSDLVLIGKIKRPSLKDVKPDMKAMQILSRIGLKALGDNGLLTVLRDELEKEGFQLHGVHRFCSQLLAPEGVMGKYAPKEEDQINIDLGIQISQTIGELDIGQSVILQDGVVIGIEAIEGTDALIERCKTLQRKGRGGVLIKTCKPQQDRDLDMPTIGTNTIEQAHKSGLVGIAVQARNTLIVDLKNVAKLADKYKIFIVGVEIPGNN